MALLSGWDTDLVFRWMRRTLLTSVASRFLSPTPTRLGVSGQAVECGFYLKEFAPKCQNPTDPDDVTNRRLGIHWSLIDLPPLDSFEDGNQLAFALFCAIQGTSLGHAVEHH